jgi:membrane-associated phospholipid phosphatase
VTATETEAQTSDAEPAASRLADAVSIASDFGAVWIAVCLVQVLARRSTPADAVRRLGIAGITSLVLTRWLKHRYAVPRDDGAPDTLARTPTSSRFPSGHTLAAFVSAIALPRSVVGRWLAIGFASLVAWARVRVGHHRLVDVLAGAAVGTAAGAALAAIIPTGAPDR